MNYVVCYSCIFLSISLPLLLCYVCVRGEDVNGTFVQLFGFVALSSDVQMGSVYTGEAIYF